MAQGGRGGRHDAEEPRLDVVEGLEAHLGCAERREGAPRRASRAVVAVRQEALGASAAGATSLRAVRDERSIAVAAFAAASVLSSSTSIGSDAPAATTISAIPGS